jgi:homoserine O-succinyltransferase/O-acetyltransferase
VTLRLVLPAAAQRDAPSYEVDESSSLTCAFINNMPDGAFDATERQFLSLLDEASNGQEIQVRRFSMPGVPRGPETSVRIDDQYLPFPSLFSSTPELLIVTGSNPIEVNIEDEPYWSDLVDVLSWARERVPTALLSCLSAHAATTIFDGVERTRLPEKRTGVFSHQVTQNHVLTRSPPPPLAVE